MIFTVYPLCTLATDFSSRADRANHLLIRAPNCTVARFRAGCFSTWTTLLKRK